MWNDGHQDPDPHNSQLQEAPLWPQERLHMHLPQAVRLSSGESGDVLKGPAPWWGGRTMHPTPVLSFLTP